MLSLKVIRNQQVIELKVVVGTYYVSPSGKDTNTGTIHSPFATIRKAASVMKPGDVCYLREGRYHEALVLENLHGLPGSPIVFDLL